MCDQDPWGMARISFGQYVFLVAVLLFALLTSLVHCSTTPKKSNSIGFVPYQDNPLMYQVGSMADASSVEGNLNVRFKPIGTYALYDENILFCGMPLGLFKDRDKVVVLVYERRARHTVGGIGCHTLVRVLGIKEERLL